MFEDLIENQLNFANKKFAAIIGENPSSGARSPKLWNAVFKELNLDVSMLPIDVVKKNITKLLEALEDDERFIGGAVAVPYKETIAEYLGGNVSDEAKKIGAVNCLYRNEIGKLCGTNTDGEASITSLKKQFNNRKAKVLILGAGGAGKAVSAYFFSYFENLTIASRSLNGKNYAKRIGAKWILFKEIDNYLSDFDIVVNTTSLGYDLQKDLSPLDKKQILSLRKNCFIFDIIYQPHKTKLLRLAEERGLKILNGLEMNLEQAVIAFNHTVNSNLNSSTIKQIMSKA